jgi:hypothetical protein
MAVYKPERKGAESKHYVCEFVIHGKRIQETTGTTSKTVAKEYERRRRAELERAAAGMPAEQKSARIRSVIEIASAYLDGYRLGHRPNSIRSAEGSLANVERIIGSVLLSDLTEDKIHTYVRQRQSEGVSGRSINMELGELSRAIGRTWKELWPKVRKLEECKDIGQALAAEQQHALLDSVEQSSSPTLKTLIPVLLLRACVRTKPFR